MSSAPAVVRGFSPLDEALALLPGQFAPRIVEGIVRLGVWMPFERVPEVFAFFTGVRVSAETVRRLTEEAGAAQVAVERAAVERLEADPPVAPQGPAIQQMSVDGAMVPLVGGAWAEVKTLAIGEVTRTATGAVQTTALSYFSRLSDAEQFTRWARGETERRGMETAGIVCAVGDGAEWLQHFVAHHRPDAVRILDFPHAAQRVCAAAQAVWGAGTAATSTWLDDQLHCLKHGDPTVVLAALRALPVAEAPSPVEAALTRDTVVAYLTTRWEQIQYARFRALGYPIGSGDRGECEQTGRGGAIEGQWDALGTGERHADGRLAGDGVQRAVGGGVADDLAGVARTPTGGSGATGGGTPCQGYRTGRRRSRPPAAPRARYRVTRPSPSAGRRRSSDRESSLAQTIASSSSRDDHARKSVGHTLSDTLTSGHNSVQRAGIMQGVCVLRHRRRPAERGQRRHDALCLRRHALPVEQPERHGRLRHRRWDGDDRRQRLPARERHADVRAGRHDADDHRARQRRHED